MRDRQQRGFVSIVVCLIIMVILSLITVGFARLMSREQRQAIDRQLSTQAFYAAESGVNDAILRSSVLLFYDKPLCSTELGGGTDGVINKEIDPIGPIRETCVTVDESPNSFVFNPISTDVNAPMVFQLYGIDAAGARHNVTDVDIEWGQAVGNTGPDLFRPGASSTLPAQTAWTSRTGMLKVTLVYYTNGDSRAQLLDKMAVAYLNPITGGAPDVDYAQIIGNGAGAIAAGGCDATTSRCRVRITNLPTTAPLFDTTIYMVISSVYRANNVTIKGFDIADQLDLKYAQVLVDSTGRAGDVLRRIQVRRPISEKYNYPGAALQTGFGDICKTLRVSPTPSVTSETLPCSL